MTTQQNTDSNATVDTAHMRDIISTSSFKKDLLLLFQMSKPTVSLLVVVTLVPAMIMAAHGFPDPMLLFHTILGTFAASASAAIFNHVVEQNTDKLMHRTRARPLAIGSLSKPKAIAGATFLGILSFLILYRFATPMAAWISLIANFFYVVIYTMYLKPRTVQNIVIGGAAGAVGPLIGWASVTGNLSLESWLMFLLIFMWTPPHFWALALKYKTDYERANIPMMPVVKGEESTRLQIAVYSVLLLPVVCLMVWLFQTSTLFNLISIGLTLWFCVLALRLYFSHKNDLSMPLFHLSCFYLFVIFVALSFDQFWL